MIEGAFRPFNDTELKQLEDYRDGNLKDEDLKSVTVNLTFNEKHQMVKLYETLLDMDLIDDCPIEVETAFDKIVEAN